MALLRLDVETPITQIVAAINKEHGLSVSKDQMQKRVKSLRPRLALEQGKIQRATSSPVSYLDRLAVPAFAGGSVVAFMGDTQFPYEDPAAWALTLAWVRDVRPSQIVLTGDILDGYSVSRFDKDPRAMSIQAELQYTHERLAELVSAAGALCQISWVAGNHEDRLARYVMGQAPQLVGLKRAGEVRELLTVPFLTAADDLGIEWIGAKPGDLGGDHNNAVLRIAPDLVATHGYFSRRGGGGASILPLVEAYDCSVIGGHDHKQGIGLVTKGGVAGSAVRRLRAISTGMLCQRDLGYAPVGYSNWQLGFATVEIHDDGSWAPDLAEIDAARGVLIWRGQRWVAPKQTGNKKGGTR
jgi:hypothetical protein